MFFGNSVNVARFDKQKFEVFEKLMLYNFSQFPVKNPLSIYPFVVGAYP
jgi:hypothetical protein